MSWAIACGGGSSPTAPAASPSPAADFQLACTPSSFANLGCGNGICTLVANGPFTGSIQLRCAGAVAGVGCRVGPDAISLSPGQTARAGLAVSVSPALVGGAFSLQVVAAGGGVTKSATIALNAATQVELPRTSGSWMVVHGCAGYVAGIPNPTDVLQYRQVFVVAAGCTQTLAAADGSFEMNVPRSCFSQGSSVDMRAGGLNACVQVPFAVGDRVWVDLFGRTVNTPCP